MSVKTVSLDEVLAEKLRDPEFREAYEKLNGGEAMADYTDYDDFLDRADVQVHIMNGTYQRRSYEASVTISILDNPDVPDEEPEFTEYDLQVYITEDDFGRFGNVNEITWRGQEPNDLALKDFIETYVLEQCLEEAEDVLGI
jgi:hypothetical protein